MIDLAPFYVTLGIALISLLITFGVFRYLESHARAEGMLGKQKVRYGGALAGFIIIFSALCGAYYKFTPSRVTTTHNLSGGWTITVTPSKGAVAHGIVQIRQTRADPYIEVAGEAGGSGAQLVAFTSLFGVIRGDEVYFIYRNREGEQGLAQGTLIGDRPDSFSIDYHDLVGFDKNDDPKGTLEFVRRNNARTNPPIRTPNEQK